MKLLPILLLISTSVRAEPHVNVMGSYDLSKSCYGMGCLPVEVLQKEIGRQTYFTAERETAERQEKLQQELNSIELERLKVEKELSQQ
ncbi:MAG: hypothetical protein D0531_07945 [Methylococcales bacterium]|nr:MAG: hypothetical protein D0531_07945 [Methylococcales bacterium]